LGQITQKSITGKSDDSQDDDGEDLYDQFQTVRQSTIYQLKLDMLLHINDYCSFVEYGTASQCLLRKQFSLDASLPNILHLTSKLLVVSSGDFDEAGISPQTFVNVPIKYELNDQCHQIQQVSFEKIRIVVGNWNYSIVINIYLYADQIIFKISQHENFAFSRSSSKNRKIKMPRKMHSELNREIKMPRKIVFAGNREIQMHKKTFYRKKLNWNDDFGF